MIFLNNYRLNERLIAFLGDISCILENSKPIMLFDDIRFMKLKTKTRRGLLENLRRHRKKMHLIWNKFAKVFLMKYGIRKDKARIWMTKDFHYKVRIFGLGK